MKSIQASIKSVHMGGRCQQRVQSHRAAVNGFSSCTGAKR